MSGPAPRLSVVVVPLLEGDTLAALLALLEAPGMLPEDAEILVVGSRAIASTGRARWVEAPQSSTVPERRELGVRLARGELVALLEDTLRPDTGWGHAVVRLHARHAAAAAIGGSLRVAPGLAPEELALALLDYGRYLRPGAVSEAAPALPGNDLSFKRTSLERAGGLAGRGLFEAELLPVLAGQGGGARLESEMGGTLVAMPPGSASLARRFQHGRLYAGRRHPHRRPERLLRALLAPLLPLLFTARALAALRRAQLPGSPRLLAQLLLLGLAASAGECVGYLRGPGAAAGSWR